MRSMDQNAEYLQVLRHDLHKARLPGAKIHKDAMPSEIARRADAMAAWMGRNFLREPFQDSLYRKSLVFLLRNFQNPRTLINQHRLELATLFNEADAVQLHDAVLHSKLLNLYCEAHQYPYSSLKYHILLTCALYYNLRQGFGLKELFLCENTPIPSPFQIIYHDEDRLWAILPHQKKEGFSRIWPKFSQGWDYRVKQSIGGEHRDLAGILTSIQSWTVALATIEDFYEFIRS
ncbi:MAG: hypothetical protein ACTSQ8_11735 [Candidatus Helarchaeota archaeon]